MKHLLLLRHAKAVPAEPGNADRDRPLAARGHRDAGLMGVAIAEERLPDLILCSPAVRTLETMNDIVAEFPLVPASITEEPLYGGGIKDYLAAIARRGGKAKTILVVGHNPTIHEAALAMAISPGARMRSKFPTAALAVIAFEIDDWAEVRPATGQLVRFVRPKDLGASNADD